MPVMTTPVQNPMQFLDPNNSLLSGGPARLDGGSITPPGQPPMGVLTFRTASTTLTVLMGAADLRNWAGIINGLADEVEGKKHLQPASVMDVAALDGAVAFKKR